MKFRQTIQLPPKGNANTGRCDLSGPHLLTQWQFGGEEGSLCYLVFGFYGLCPTDRVRWTFTPDDPYSIAGLSDVNDQAFGCSVFNHLGTVTLSATVNGHVYGPIEVDVSCGHE